MPKNRILLLLLPLLFLCLHTQAQDSLTVQAFFNQILENHPYSRQAELLSERARMEIRMARGALDPALSGKHSSKEFEGKDYYTKWNGELRVPLLFGPELKAGYEQNTGPFINPESKTSKDGLSYIGITVPIGQGLWTDERRNTLRQAKLMQNLAEAERLGLLNKLLLQAAKDYWDWLYFYREVQLFEEMTELAAFRLRGVRERAKEGDLAAIDTLEALTAVQDRQTQLTQALLSYANAKLKVENYLWSDEGEPLALEPDVVPAATGSELLQLPATTLEQLLEQAKQNHPDLLKLEVKQEQLTAEQRFLSNKLLPKLNLEYNLLQPSFFEGNDVTRNAYWQNNYRLGISFYQPLFLRQERGKRQLNRLKIQENQLSQNQVGREIQNQVLQSFNEWVALAQQIELQLQMVQNYRTLLNGEIIRFQNGESSLFLVNSRELKLMEAQQKLFSLQAKYAKAKANLAWAAGNLSVTVKDEQAGR
ncbi:MAG: TolC family protein [Hymenobacteraceae bacterium]|nr:TolC family protein [Hymenobacteraceae bacterium]